MLLLALACPAAASVGDRIARRAAGLVGRGSLAIEHDDCSGFVEFVYGHERVPLAGSAEELRRVAASRRALRLRQMRPGDLVFFRNTTARRGITHVGIVESVTPGGEATFVHRTSKGVVRSRLDLRRPDLQRDAHGRVHNDVLRRAGRGTRARLTGELFAGVADADRMAAASARPASR